MQDPLIDTIYVSVGSDEPYYKLINLFYQSVEVDPLLRPLYPLDLTESKRHLALFLIQRTGGKQTYSIERGHPRMRSRHMPFKIGLAERNAWMNNMDNALAEVHEFAAHRDVLHNFFADFATFMINQPDNPEPQP